MILNNAQNIILGNNEAEKIYCGDVVVWTESAPPSSGLPIKRGVDGIFEYGSLDGSLWKNAVEGQNDIDFSISSATIQDTGSEYILPRNKYGRYISANGNYNIEFTWYAVLKYAGISSQGVFGVANENTSIYPYQGFEISSGWGSNKHCIRGLDQNDFITSALSTQYALIIVAGAYVTNQMLATIYVNGVKEKENWNFHQAASNNQIQIGRRASGLTSDVAGYYKFLAFATAKHTDEEVATNSAYIMEKYGLN